MKTIKTSEKTWRKLMRWKLDLGCRNLEEVIDRILNIVKASDLEPKKEASKK